MFAEEVLPVLRRETENRKALGTPEPPTHANRLASRIEIPSESKAAVDDVTGGSFYDHLEDDAAVAHADELIARTKKSAEEEFVARKEHDEEGRG